MATKKKMLQAAAGNAGGAGGAGGAGLDITDVFSTYLYDGNGGAQTINNGIALGDGPDDGVYYLSSPNSLTGNNSAVSFVSATVDGTVTLNSGTTKFASNSYDFDGASNIRLSRALIDTASSFCFETWVYFDSTGVSNDMAMLLAQYKSGEDGRLLFGAQNGNLVVRYNGGNAALTASVSASQWYHVAWSYDGTTHRLFIDGTLEDSTTLDFPIYTGVTTQLGGTDPTLLSGYDLNGNMEDIRITTGDARYTASFTPPTASLPVTTAVTAGEGGLVWVKDRDAANGHNFYDTERGATKRLSSNLTSAETTRTNGVTSFNSNGFSGGNDASINTNGNDFASWTWRKAPKFFTCLTYTGNGVAGRTVSHDLGSTPGMIIVKKTSSSTNSNWIVYHKDITASSYGKLNSTDAFTTSFAQYYWGNGTSTVNPTSTEFTVGDTSNLNGSGETYVAYLFAHNDGDGGFGPDGDQDIIKCGSYTGGGSSDVDVDLGFEPQFVLVKGADIARGWVMGDIMRGAPVGSNGQRLFANTSDAETTEDTVFTPTPTGFKVKANTGGTVNDSGLDYIYIAIRRGPLAPPESGTEVFDVALGTGTYTHTTGFPVDLAIQASRASTIIHRPYDRLRGGGFYLETSDSTAEANGGTAEFDNNTGYTNYGAALNTVDFMWKRAPGFCDVVAYKGDAVAGRTVSHNLGVAPEMMVFKNRDTSGTNWDTYHKDLGPNGFVSLNLENAYISNINRFNNTNPTDTEFTLGTAIRVNGSGDSLIAYLFASLPGISKVGSYTGNSSSQTIDCGFTSGARFVLIKCSSDGLSDWHVMDSARGIVAGNDPFLYLNNTTAEDTGEDIIDPYSGGFALPANNRVNASGRTYIFYAIA